MQELNVSIDNFDVLRNEPQESLEIQLSEAQASEHPEWKRLNYIIQGITGGKHNTDFIFKMKCEQVSEGLFLPVAVYGFNITKNSDGKAVIRIGDYESPIKVQQDELGDAEFLLSDKIKLTFADKKGQDKNYVVAYVGTEKFKVVCRAWVDGDPLTENFNAVQNEEELAALLDGGSGGNGGYKLKSIDLTNSNTVKETGITFPLAIPLQAINNDVYTGTTSTGNTFTCRTVTTEKPIKGVVVKKINGKLTPTTGEVIESLSLSTYANDRALGVLHTPYGMAKFNLVKLFGGKVVLYLTKENYSTAILQFQPPKENLEEYKLRESKLKELHAKRANYDYLLTTPVTQSIDDSVKETIVNDFPKAEPKKLVTVTADIEDDDIADF